MLSTLNLQGKYYEQNTHHYGMDLQLVQSPRLLLEC